MNNLSEHNPFHSNQRDSTLRPETLDEYVDWEKLSKSSSRKLRGLLRDTGLDGIIITSMDSFRWLTGIPTITAWFYKHIHTAVLSQDAEEPIIIALEGFQDIERLWFMDVRSLPFRGELRQPLYADRWPDLCAEAVKDAGIASGKIGLDPDTPYVLKEALAVRLPNATIVSAADVIKDARIIKSREELKAIRVACAIGEMGMKAAMDMINEGIREREVAGAIVNAFLAYGAEAPLATPLVLSGVRHKFIRASEKIIRRQELVRVDLGCVYGGYNSDFSRTAYVGTPPAEIQKTYDALREAHETGMNLVRSGVTNTYIYRAVKDRLEELTEGKCTLAPILGHGLGVGVHESPMIGDEAHTEKVKLQKGMYFCLEPSVWTPDGQMMIEDDLIVTETGAEILTRIGRELIIKRPT